MGLRSITMVVDLACCTNDWSYTWSDLDLDNETSLVIWDIESGRRLSQRETGISGARAKYSLDGSTIVVSGNEAGSRLEVYEAELATLLANANHDEPGVVSFSSDGQVVQLLDQRGVRKTWAVSKNWFLQRNEDGLCRPDAFQSRRAVLCTH